MLNILSVPNKVKCCAAYEFILHFSFFFFLFIFHGPCRAREQEWDGNTTCIKQTFSNMTWVSENLSRSYFPPKILSKSKVILKILRLFHQILTTIIYDFSSLYCKTNKEFICHGRKKYSNLYCIVWLQLWKILRIIMSWESSWEENE